VLRLLQPGRGFPGLGLAEGLGLGHLLVFLGLGLAHDFLRVSCQSSIDSSSQALKDLSLSSGPGSTRAVQVSSIRCVR
jgi:hypothetical protein